MRVSCFRDNGVGISRHVAMSEIETPDWCISWARVGRPSAASWLPVCLMQHVAFSLVMWYVRPANCERLHVSRTVSYNSSYVASPREMDPFFFLLCPMCVCGSPLSLSSIFHDLLLPLPSA